MIFVAGPYSHTDKTVVDYRVKTICEYSANMLRNKISCIGAITTGIGILSQTNLPTDFEFWQHLSYDLLGLCNEMHVLMLEGWEESIGVVAEIKFANEHNIPIKYIKF